MADIWFKQGKTFDKILDDNRGMGPGFSLLRIALAILILMAHTGWITGGIPQASPAPSPSAAASGTAFVSLIVLKRPFSDCLVPMFFALSGFLVTGSALRLRTVGKFMSARLFRLVPALCVEVTLSALVLGPIYTGHPLAAYFTDPMFYRYFLNMFGFITFELPGVFVDNPWPRIVNINLWTLPSEFYCYLFMCGALISKLVLNRKWFSWAFALGTVALVLLNAFGLIATDIGVALTVLIYCFFVGVVFFMWRERIVYSWPLFLLCSLLTYAAMLDRHLYILACIPLTYVTIFVGLTKLPRIPILTSGDYSYGLYLYGFPISQALIASVPEFHGHRLLFAMFALPLGIAFAAFSWHVIEKPALRLKGWRSARVKQRSLSTAKPL
jgi:peptidoglycan/LPS O-acetylase OafA/YrhL